MFGLCRAGSKAGELGPRVNSTLDNGPIDSGADLHGWATDLFPIGRSLTGDGVRATLAYLADLVPALTIHEVPSGTSAFDWQVPDEWNIRSGYIADADGQRLVDYATNNLHVVGYSEPVDLLMTRDELEPRLHSLADQVDAIPYVTSYYRRTWGFCLSHRQRESLGTGPFRVVIDADLKPGSLTYGELTIPGESDQEVLLSTYVCHPSMANNELSGPVVAVALARWISALAQRRYTYRVLFLPETIGSITYLSTHLAHLKAHLRAGWVLTCLGDEAAYSYVPSRYADTLADRVCDAVIRDLNLDCRRYSFLDRGSDERQYCSPGVDLPVASLMRSKYGTFPEYHTSLDDLTFVTPAGLQGGLDMMAQAVRVMETNRTWQAVGLCEPQMGRHGLYPTTSTPTSGFAVRSLMNVLAYLDGTNDAIDVARICGLSVAETVSLAQRLHESGLVIEVASEHGAAT